MSKNGLPVVERHTHIAPQVVFLDGLTGTGKTMMGPILSTFRRMEVQRIEHTYEYTCALRYLERMEEDAAVHLLRMHIDLACYNMMIGRETNFRWKDLSGVLGNPGGWRYVRRLLLPDGDAVVERINAARPILQIHSHQALGIAVPLFHALGDRLTVIEMVRHPLYLLEHWYSYIDRHGADPRDFTIWLHYNGEHLPWFAYGWEEKYVASKKMDRVIYSIEELTRLAEDTVRGLDEASRRRVLMIPFDGFVVDPWPYLRQIEGLLGTETTSSTSKAMRKQKVPRKLSTAGRDLQAYRQYNWQPPSKDSDESSELQKRWVYAAREATREGMEALERMCVAYEERYMCQKVSA